MMDDGVVSRLRIEECNLAGDFGTGSSYVYQRKPAVGMEFLSEDDAYNFYSSYAKSVGFSVRKSYYCRSKINGHITSRKIVCSKEGFKNLNDKRSEGKFVKRRRETREGCRAHIYVHENASGTWFIKRFHEEHNHDFGSMSEVARLPARQNMISFMKETTETSRVYEVVPSSNLSTCGALTEEHINHTLQPHKQARYKHNMGPEWVALQEELINRGILGDGFFYEFDLGKDGQVRNILWADNRCRANYMNFGDVLLVDTSYKEKGYRVPFAPLIGINHQRQPTLFGCSLLTDEDEGTFTWLFNAWLSCMYGKQPIAIISYPDPAICDAIAKVFPRIRHRFCPWHIARDALTHLPELQYDKQFQDDYNQWVYETKSCEEFENKWIRFKEKYKIKVGSWLSKMYDKRDHWNPLYLKGAFFVGMSSSCFDSMDAFFDGFLSPQTRASEFLYQCDRALVYHREVEEREDLLTSFIKVVIDPDDPIEVQAKELYTPSILKLFQKELINARNCVSDEVAKDGRKVTYLVYLPEKDRTKYIVDYFPEPEGQSMCSCKKFEHEGILCSHILHIFKKKGVMALPENYILHRWTINASYFIVNSVVQASLPNYGENKITLLMKGNLHCNVRKLMELARRSVKHCQVTMTRMQGIVRELNEICSQRFHDQASTISIPGFRSSVSYDNSNSQAQGSVRSLEASEITPWNLSTTVEKVIALATKSSKCYHSLLSCVQYLLDELKEVCSKEVFGQASTTSVPAFTHPVPAAHATYMGSSKKGEWKSSIIEMSPQREVKKRTCSRCGEKGHYMTTCPLSNISPSQRESKGRFCSLCGEKGHYMTTCRQHKTVQDVEQEVVQSNTQSADVLSVQRTLFGST